MQNIEFSPCCPVPPQASVYLRDRIDFLEFEFFLIVFQNPAYLIENANSPIAKNQWLIDVMEMMAVCSENHCL
jgi:hypothetical protein